MNRYDVALAAVALVVLWVVAQVVAGEPALVETLAPPAYAVQDVTGAVVDTAPPLGRDATTIASPAASVTQTADRGDRVQLEPPVPSGPPPPTDGDCASWRPLLDRYGIPYDQAVPIMRRESHCSMAHNYNRATGDDSWGPFQVNRWGRLAAWWDSGGYTADVMATPAGAVAAAAVLYHSCRWAPWVKPYGCDGDYLQVPEPRWQP